MSQPHIVSIWYHNYDEWWKVTLPGVSTIWSCTFAEYSYGSLRKSPAIILSLRSSIISLLVSWSCMEMDEAWAFRLTRTYSNTWSAFLKVQSLLAKVFEPQSRTSSASQRCESFSVSSSDSSSPSRFNSSKAWETTFLKWKPEDDVKHAVPVSLAIIDQGQFLSQVCLAYPLKCIIFDRALPKCFQNHPEFLDNGKVLIWEVFILLLG